MKLTLSRDEVAGVVGPELKRRRIPYRRDIDGDAISYVIINDDKVDVGAFITSPGKTKVEIFPHCPDEDIESLGKVLQVLEAAVWQEQERREWIQKVTAEIDTEMTGTGRSGEGTNGTGRIHNLGEGSPGIIGIPSGLYRKLRSVLSECGPFATDQELTAIFIDERVRPWRNRLPQADSRIGRVERVIDFLHNQYNDVGESALVLLLRVLSERLDPGDACHHRLAKLADELDHELTSLINDIFERPERPIQKPSQVVDTPGRTVITKRNEFLQQLKTAFNDDDLASLCFKLNVAYDDLSGDNRKRRFLSLIDQLERENRVQEFIVLCKEERPQYNWDGFVRS
jgi:hypothetical protein